MKRLKSLQISGPFLVILFLTSCTIYAVTPPPLPIEQGQPPQQPEQSVPQPSQSGPQPGGQGPAPSQSVQIDQKVNVPGGGGSAEIAFDISNGQWVHIQLTADNPSTQPYGSLQHPDGISQDFPPLQTAANGANQGDILLTDNGHYTLTLFDGSNQGGSVSVKIVGLQ